MDDNDVNINTSSRANCKNDNQQQTTTTTTTTSTITTWLDLFTTNNNTNSLSNIDDNKKSLKLCCFNSSKNNPIKNSTNIYGSNHCQQSTNIICRECICPSQMDHMNKIVCVNSFLSINSNYQLQKCDLCGFVMFSFNILKHTWYHHPKEFLNILNVITEKYGSSPQCMEKVNQQCQNQVEKINCLNHPTTNYSVLTNDYLISFKNTHIYRHRYKEINLRVPKTRGLTTRIKDNSSKLISKNINDSTNNCNTTIPKSQELITTNNISIKNKSTTIQTSSTKYCKPTAKQNTTKQQKSSTLLPKKDWNTISNGISTQEFDNSKTNSNNENMNITIDDYVVDDSSFSCGDDANDADYTEPTSRNISSQSNNSRKYVSKSKFESKFKNRKRAVTTTLTPIDNNLEMVYNTSKISPIETTPIDLTNVGSKSNKITTVGDDKHNTPSSSSSSYNREINNTTIIQQETTIKPPNSSWTRYSFVSSKNHYPAKNILSPPKNNDIKYDSSDVNHLKNCLKLSVLKNMLNDCRRIWSNLKKASKRVNHYYKFTTNNQLCIVTPHYSNLTNEIMLSVVFSNNYGHRFQKMSLTYWKFCSQNVRKIDIQMEDTTDKGHNYITKLILQNSKRLIKKTSKDKLQYIKPSKSKTKVPPSRYNTGIVSVVNSIKKLNRPKQYYENLVDGVMRMSINGLPSGGIVITRILSTDKIDPTKTILLNTQEFVPKNIKECINDPIGSLNGTYQFGPNQVNNFTMEFKNGTDIINNFPRDTPTNLDILQPDITAIINNSKGQHNNITISDVLRNTSTNTDQVIENLNLNIPCKSTSARSLSDNSDIQHHMNGSAKYNLTQQQQQQQQQHQQFLYKQRLLENIKRCNNNKNININNLNVGNNPNSISVSQAILLHQLIQQQQQQQQQQFQYDNRNKQINNVRNSQLNQILVNQQQNYDSIKSQSYLTTNPTICCVNNKIQSQQQQQQQQQRGVLPQNNFSQLPTNTLNITNNLSNGIPINHPILKSNVANCNNKKVVSKNVLLNQQFFNNPIRYITPEMVQKLSNEELLLLREYLAQTQKFQPNTFTTSKNMSNRLDNIQPTLTTTPQQSTNRIFQQNQTLNNCRFNVENGNRPILFDSTMRSSSSEIKSSTTNYSKNIDTSSYTLYRNRYSSVNPNNIINGCNNGFTVHSNNINNNNTILNNYDGNNNVSNINRHSQAISDPNIHSIPYTTNVINRNLNKDFTTPINPPRNGDILSNFDNINTFKVSSQNDKNILHQNLYNSHINNIPNQIRNNILTNQLDNITSQLFPQLNNNFTVPPSNNVGNCNGVVSNTNTSLNNQHTINQNYINTYMNESVVASNGKFHFNTISNQTLKPSTQVLNFKDYEILKNYLNNCVQRQHQQPQMVGPNQSTNLTTNSPIFSTPNGVIPSYINESTVIDQISSNPNDISKLNLLQQRSSQPNSLEPVVNLNVQHPSATVNKSFNKYGQPYQ